VKFFGAILLGVAFCGCASRNNGPVWSAQAQRQQHQWGYYNGQVETRWENDGRTMTLINELRYTDPEGVIWVAPAGSVVDGASIPRALWSFMGGPFEGRYRNGSVLHDVSYDQHTRPWQQCDRMFYNAMRCSGVSASEAKTMYYALYKFGRHWKRPRSFAGATARSDNTVPRAIPVNDEEFTATRSWIESANPSLAQIEERADATPQ
jgi:Protein of unknown function (DUF1353)